MRIVPSEEKPAGMGGDTFSLYLFCVFVCVLGSQKKVSDTLELHL